MQANSVFNAAYAAIFLYFVRRTVRKVQPFRTRGYRYCLFVPFNKTSVMVGSSDSVEALMPMVGELVQARYFVELYDRKKFISRDYGPYPKNNTGWRNWPPARRDAEKMSAFSITDPDINHHAAVMERISARHGQSPATTTF